MAQEEEARRYQAMACALKRQARQQGKQSPVVASTCTSSRQAEQALCSEDTQVTALVALSSDFFLSMRGI